VNPVGTKRGKSEGKSENIHCTFLNIKHIYLVYGYFILMNYNIIGNGISLSHYHDQWTI